MRLGIGSYTFVWSVGVPGYAQPASPMTPLALLGKAVELGVSVVQIADRMPLHRMSRAELTTLRHETSVRNLTLEIGTAGIGTGHLRRYIEIASHVHARLIRTVIDGESTPPSPSEAVALLAAVAPQLEAQGITLAIENHERLSAKTLRHIVDDVGSAQIGICLDTANSLGCSEGAEQVLEVLGPRTCCLHVKDYTACRLPHRFGFLIEGCAAGKGDLDIPRWLARLGEMGRDVNVILELWPAPEANLEATIAKEMRWATESVTYLRHLGLD